MALGRERKQSEVDEEPIEKGQTAHKYSSGFAFYRFWLRHIKFFKGKTYSIGIVIISKQVTRKTRLAFPRHNFLFRVLRIKKVPCFFDEANEPSAIF